MSKIKLYYIPHAGGSAMGYMRMKSYLNNDFIEPIPLELAGRGKRISEPCFTDGQECAKDLKEKLEELNCDSDFAIFGHSLGCALAFEVADILQRENKKMPVCVFLSGRDAPCGKISIPKISQYPDEIFLKRFNELQAIPTEWNNPKIMELMIPILRADVQMSEKGDNQLGKKLICDISILYGEEDVLVDKSCITDWSNFTTEKCNYKMF